MFVKRKESSMRGQTGGGLREALRGTEWALVVI